MRLENISATPSPTGNRIDLKWVNPDSVQFPGVRVVRREGTHPVTPQDGVLVAEGLGLNFAADKHLKGETVYYYALFPFQGAPPLYQVDPHNRVSAMATAPYNFAGQMYELLPAIYHRYDTVLPKPGPGMPEEDQQRGQLRRFLDLPGTQLDQFYSFARAMLDLYSLDRVDGRLLPLLAEWIGWKTDSNRGIDVQRNEIRNALAIYETMGLIPTVEATVKRISGWDSKTKEFVHNVFLSNRPERLNIWARQRGTAGTWSVPTQPLSLNFAYEGRPAAALDADGTLWLFYHTLKNRQWHIWYKTSPDGREWAPSQPLTDRGDIDKHPAATLQGATLWVFWDSCDETDIKWRVDFRTRTGGVWSGTQTFEDATIERRLPSVVADNAGGLWLFWLEKAGSQWQLKYNRHNGTDWQLNPAAVFPLDGGIDPRVEGDVFVLFHPASVNQSLWVFWARQEPSGAEQTHYSIVYRVKQGIDPNVSDWSIIRTLPKVGADDYHDREPAPLLDATGNIELFWSSNQTGNWSVWSNTLDITAHTFGAAAEQITNDPYSQRTPLAIPIGADTLLMYRSNESLTYTSQLYSATQTVDFRYAGSITADTRNAAVIALRGKFDDFQGYTYDAGLNGQRTNEDWYARDTIGLYLMPDTADPARIAAIKSRINQVLGEFMPITDRAVFFT